MNSSPYFSPPRARAIAAVPFWKRRQRVLAASFLLVWPAYYTFAAHSAPLSSRAPEPAPMTLRVGKSMTLPLSAGASYSIERGANLALCEANESGLTVRALSPGLVWIRIKKANGSSELVALRFATASSNTVLASGDPASAPMDNALSATPKSGASTRMIVDTPGTSGGVDPLDVMPPIPSNLGGTSNSNSGSSTGTSVSPLPSVGLTSPVTGSGGSTSLPLPAIAPVRVRPRPTQNTSRPQPTQNTSRLQPRPQTARPSIALPVMGGSSVERYLPPSPPRAIEGNASNGATRITPPVLPPTTGRRANVSYSTTSHLPPSVRPGSVRPGLEVQQGLARLVTFPDNILSVFFSNPDVMDARAINARTIAVTGSGPGTSTLAVFTSRFPGDAVGDANVYRVQTLARGGSSVNPLSSRDPQALEASITAALGDPRVRATVVRLPDGSFAGRLQGVVRNEAEVTGAVSTASFYVPRVVSSLYADINAPSIDAVRSGAISPLSPTDTLQDSLRRLTGNSSIELVTLPTGLALKASTDSPEEAEAILRIVPSLNQNVIPFIVVRGLANAQSPYYNSEVPVLQGEDRQLTDKLQAVTGVRTVYAVRASSNSVAIYGNVRTRAQYQAVSRYGLIIAQQAAPIAAQGTSQGGAASRPLGSEVALPGYDPEGGYVRPLGVQMFVRILDPDQATVRNVTVETNVVEISRTALQNLGVQFGTAAITSENITAGSGGTVTVLRDAAGNPVVNAQGNPVTTTTGATPSTRTRTINPSFNPGVVTAANGFAGGGALQFLDPFRAQLNFLSQRGDARILARPNLRALEGMSAQIIIGGQRPVVSAVATTGAVANGVEFRPYGVIISMRPTVSDDNTIILQIQAAISQPDPTFQVNVNGALIPGETTRSVDTTLMVRPGDVVVMGGLMTNEKRLQTSKVPILGDLPIIGSLFRSKRFENNETELAIFMTPRIDSLPATENTLAIIRRAQALPPLPSPQQTTGIAFQSPRGP